MERSHPPAKRELPADDADSQGESKKTKIDDMRLAVRRVWHLVLPKLFLQNYNRNLLRTLSDQDRKTSRLPPFAMDRIRWRPYEVINNILELVANSDRQAASCVMQCSEVLYLCTARHFFRAVHLELHRRDFSREENVKTVRTREGLFKKMIQWTQDLELDIPRVLKAQDSFSATVNFLKAMALSRLRFLQGSQLSTANHVNLLQKLQPGRRLRRSIKEIHFPDVTDCDAIAMTTNPNGTRPLMDLKLDVFFKSTEDKDQSIHMISEGHLAHDGKIINGSPKKSFVSFLRPYAHSEVWIGSITITEQSLIQTQCSETPSEMLGLALLGNQQRTSPLCNSIELTSPL